jgi:hypothetical protein
VLQPMRKSSPYVQKFGGKRKERGGKEGSKNGDSHRNGCRRPTVAQLAVGNCWLFLTRRPLIHQQSLGQRLLVIRYPGDQQLSSGDYSPYRWQPAVARRPRPTKLPPPFFCNFLKKIKRPLHVARAWDSLGGMCTALPFFEPYPYTWERKIFHSSWNMEISFFWNFFLKLEYTWTFMSTIGILVS